MVDFGWNLQIWLGGVSLKRSSKMQLECDDIHSMSPSLKSYDQIKFQPDLSILRFSRNVKNLPKLSAGGGGG